MTGYLLLVSLYGFGFFVTMAGVTMTPEQRWPASSPWRALFWPIFLVAELIDLGAEKRRLARLKAEVWKK